MRILITGIGGPAGICFARSLYKIQGVELIGVNAEKDSISIKFLKSFHIIPFANDPTFLDSISEIIKSEKIDFIIPLVDEELSIISANKNKISCRVLVSSIETIRLTTDKGLLYNKLSSILPKRYDSVNTQFPLFVKPKIGRGGKDTHIVLNSIKLQSYDERKYVFQELLKGTEITVDTLFDFDGQLIVAIPRIRSKVEQGISIRGEIINDLQIINEVKRISKILKFIGPINFQFMKSKKDFKLLEINARSSGGMGITINSGVDIPKITFELMQKGFVNKKIEIHEGLFNNFKEIVERQKIKTINLKK